MGAPVPRFTEARIEPTDLTEIVPVEHRADRRPGRDRAGRRPSEARGRGAVGHGARAERGRPGDRGGCPGAHGQSAAGLAIAVAALAAAAGLDQEQQALYLDVVLSSLNEAARRSLETKMKSGYEFQSDFARSYVAKGRLEGQREEAASAVLKVLEARGLEIPAEVRERVLASTDMTELDRWLRRAVLVADAKALFDTTSS
ncbi:hypothetical protein WMF20_47760 [Sorangium sp. So ce834]|uniref:hypothetical protein n=1 Tax=Sorangium sp. So ce834 TaxID=3133321 RepID=UPI003F6209FD